MKTLLKIATITMVLGFATVASAQRGSQQLIANKTYHKADSVDSIMSMVKGDLYALVCKECDALTIKEVANDKEVAGLCHEGGSVYCPSCKKKYTFKNVGPRQGGAMVAFVNDKGKSCMTVVPLKG